MKNYAGSFNADSCTQICTLSSRFCMHHADFAYRKQVLHTQHETGPALNAYDYETILHHRHTVKEKRIV